MSGIAFVTTCKGRLKHIRQTLPMLVAQSPEEIVVVDYGCPEGVGDWVAANYPNVAVVRVNDDSGFCVGRARNIGARHVKSTWICFIDADIQAKPGWIEWMRGHLEGRSYYRVEACEGQRDKETWGTFVCSREAFEKVEGFDEVFRGWGGEDDDLYARLRFLGMIEATFPARFIEPISHDEAERFKYYDVKDRDIHHCINQFYSEAKFRIMSIQGRIRQLPLSTRTDLMNRIRKQLLSWSKGESEAMPKITFTVTGTGWLPEPYRMLKKCSFTLTLGRTSGADQEQKF